MKVLVIEDDPTVGPFIKRGLEQQRWSVDLTADGIEGERLARTQPYDVVVLDMRLPGKQGLEILRDLRSWGFERPVLVLTAQDAVDAKVTTLRAGADDYVTKPFSVAELLARVRALLKRAPQADESGTQTPGTLTFGDVVVDLTNREVKKEGALIQLSFKEFELLKYLALRRGRTVSRDELLEEIWGVDVEAGVTTRTVDTHIANVRGKLAGGELDRPFIVTVHKVGYKFVG